MTFISWSEAYTLQVGTIDDEHKRIIEIINALERDRREGADSAALGSSLARMQEVIQEHFENEEAIMREHYYPYRGAHKEQHRQFNRDVYAARKLYSADADSIDFDVFLAFLRAWLHEHIVRSDAIFVSYLSGGARPTTVLPAVDPLPECLEGVLADPDDPLHTVSMQVPESALDTLFTCARLLRRGGGEADALRAIADPLGTMTLVEAATVAKALMR
ncbi:MAG: hemerythrin family protein [Rhodospirillales bacterium]|nr:hemerythrin family protein [Rhodospirillales bacterium]